LGSDDYPLSIVRHRWQEVITESNHAALIPGSAYDILTHFEQNSGRTRRGFIYLFFDTGLGAADPIYPVFQVGYQQNGAGKSTTLRAISELVCEPCVCRIGRRGAASHNSRS